MDLSFLFVEMISENPHNSIKIGYKWDKTNVVQLTIFLFKVVLRGLLPIAVDIRLKQIKKG